MKWNAMDKNKKKFHEMHYPPNGVKESIRWNKYERRPRLSFTNYLSAGQYHLLTEIQRMQGLMGKTEKSSG